MIRLSFLFLAALSLGLAAADVPTTGAKVSAVTVYSDRAEVVRHLKTRLEAGEHTLVYDHLPAQTDLSSVRVEGRGDFTLIDIRTETNQGTEISDQRVRALNDLVAGQEANLQQVTLAANRNALRRTALDKVLTRLTGVGKDAASPDLDPAKWAGYLTYHVASLAKLDQELIDQQVQRENIQEEINRLQREIGELDGQTFKARHSARVKVELKQASEVEIDFSYLVVGPAWTPLYDVRADTAAKTLAITYKAQLQQSTGEDWKGVSLRLSTARPGVGGREPQLGPWIIDKYSPAPDSGVTVSAANAAGRSLGLRDLREEQLLARNAPALHARAKNQLEAMSEQPMGAALSATSATFTITRAYDVLSDNKPARVAITQLNFSAGFRHSCVPKLSPFVYLKAIAKNQSDFPFLAGSAAVFLDGAFVANSTLDGVPTGQEFTSFLGVDQGISVERKELAKREESSGVFGKKTLRTVYDNLFKIKNTKNTSVDLTISDQIPISNHEEIKVIVEEPRFQKNTEAFKITDQKTTEWRLNLAPGQKLDVPFRFAVERPEDFQLLNQ